MEIANQEKRALIKMFEAPVNSTVAMTPTPRSSENNRRAKRRLLIRDLGSSPSEALRDCTLNRNDDRLGCKLVRENLDVAL